MAKGLDERERETTGDALGKSGHGRGVGALDQQSDRYLRPISRSRPRQLTAGARICDGDERSSARRLKAGRRRREGGQLPSPRFPPTSPVIHGAACRHLTSSQLLTERIWWSRALRPSAWARKSSSRRRRRATLLSRPSHVEPTAALRNRRAP